MRHHKTAQTSAIARTDMVKIQVVSGFFLTTSVLVYLLIAF